MYKDNAGRRRREMEEKEAESFWMRTKQKGTLDEQKVKAHTGMNMNASY